MKNTASTHALNPHVWVHCFLYLFSKCYCCTRSLQHVSPPCTLLPSTPSSCYILQFFWLLPHCTTWILYSHLKRVTEQSYIYLITKEIISFYEGAVAYFTNSKRLISGCNLSLILGNICQFSWWTHALSHNHRLVSVQNF